MLAQTANSSAVSEEATRQRNFTISGFGGPLIRTMQVMDDWGILIGGKGGGIINHQFAFGGVGMALADGYDFVGDNLNGNENAELNLGLGAGGVFIEYIHRRDNLIQFSVPLHIMAGGVSVKENDEEIESSGIFILEPGINLEFNITDHFIPGIGVSYMQVFGSSLENVDNRDISGITIGLVFKFGGF
ncbi:hypothetical protein AB2B38_011105 [Balneola sp. MJW-20]|uniref:hypothetical protein n=1 Tax=Gracilimonas aurantiaca TaxID=3234185 RepID=UPI0034656E88